MEVRNVIIVSNAANRRYTLQTGAETLGELKADMREAHIDFDGMTFMEGLTKTELLQDSSLLPRDVVRGEGTTNELVFLLTVANKKIKSGADYASLRATVGASQEMKDYIQKTYGRNYTNVGASVLQAVVDNFAKKGQPVVAASGTCTSTAAVRKLADALKHNGYLTTSQYNDVVASLAATPAEEKIGSYTKSELDAIVNSL